jgi:hypothetical protein
MIVLLYQENSVTEIDKMATKTLSEITSAVVYRVCDKATKAFLGFAVPSDDPRKAKPYYVTCKRGANGKIVWACNCPATIEACKHVRACLELLSPEACAVRREQEAKRKAEVEAVAAAEKHLANERVTASRGYRHTVDGAAHRLAAPVEVRGTPRQTLYYVESEQAVGRYYVMFPQGDGSWHFSGPASQADAYIAKVSAFLAVQQAA